MMVKSVIMMITMILLSPEAPKTPDPVDLDDDLLDEMK